MKEMSKKEAILEDLRRSVSTWDIELAKRAAKEAMDIGLTPTEIVEKGLGKGMAEISQKFDEATIYLPQVLAASNAMEAAMKVLAPMMNGVELPSKGTVVIGTVHGDIHEIGKNVVGAMLRGAGYNVIDLGRDVPIENFIDAAREKKADVVGASALMTTTMVGQKEIVEFLEEEGLRENVRTIFGGAPCNKKWVDSIGGDMYCPSGAEAVAMVDALVRK
ncbi:MAG: Trimethylamine corrinoid protein [Methanomassiliicoccales archaeon PtaU1.Bin124]|nr:MAG: Trimethylamine corrinoid protein [Methanomassiliicoccales archaeon PtaU1.Bin124]